MKKNSGQKSRATVPLKETIFAFNNNTVTLVGRTLPGTGAAPASIKTTCHLSFKDCVLLYVKVSNKNSSSKAVTLI
jgi:hypothetical protein